METSSQRPSYPHLCYAGLSILMLTFVLPCLMITMFLMEAPWRYLTATQVLYPIVLCLYILHILLDLAIMTWSTKNRIQIRTVLAVLCPALGAILSLPTMGMLAHTKNEGGFTSSQANAALTFAIIGLLVQLFHVLFVVWLYWAYRHKETCFGLINLPCCACFVGKVPDENLQLPSAAEPDEISISQTIGPAYTIHRFDSVEFHPHQSGLVFNRSDSNPPNASTSQMVSLPDPIPPPPRVTRVKNKQVEQIETTKPEEDRNTSIVLPSDIDIGFGPEPYNAEIERGFGELAERQESLRAEVEFDYPTSEIQMTPDKDVKSTDE